LEIFSTISGVVSRDPVKVACAHTLFLSLWINNEPRILYFLGEAII
jgi:hypothetical protein